MGVLIQRILGEEIETKNLLRDRDGRITLSLSEAFSFNKIKSLKMVAFFSYAVNFCENDGFSFLLVK